MNVNEMSASQIIGQLNMMFDWKRRPYEGKLLQRAIELLKEQGERIEQLEHDLAITQNNLNYYMNGND